VNTLRLGFTAIATLAAALAASACGESNEALGPNPQNSDSSETHLIRVYLTDAPFPFDAVQSVEVYIASISASTSTDTAGDGTADWVTITTPNRRFELLQLQRGNVALVGEGELPADLYRAVRMVVNTDSSSITFTDGSDALVQWQVPGELTMNALVEAPLEVSDGGVDIVIDFDVGRSFLPLNDRLVFIPWFRAVNRAATGSIMGMVTHDSAGSTPVENAAVTVFRGDSTMPPNTWSVAATGRADSAGRYEVHFLLGGTYIVQASPPDSLSLGVATRFGVGVAAQQTTTVDLILPPGITGPALVISGGFYAVVGDSAILYATVYGANGDTVVNPQVSWSSANPQVAQVNGSGPVVAVATLTPGVASIIATSGTVADTATLTVMADSTTPAASLTLSPDSLTLAVGDSAAIAATVRDSNGVVVAGAGAFWTVSDSGVVDLAVSFPGTTAYLTALAPGVTSIIATSGSVADTAMVTVTASTAGAVATVTLSPATLTLTVGADSAWLVATLRDSAGTELTGRTVAWTVSDSTLVELTPFANAAMLRGIAPGTATVVAASEGKSDTATVSVNQ